VRVAEASMDVRWHRRRPEIAGGRRAVRPQEPVCAGLDSVDR